jgi:hypothetical protein
MKNKHQVHNLVILGKIGSMNSIKALIINRFNELVQSIKGIEERFPNYKQYVAISYNCFFKSF